MRIQINGQTLELRQGDITLEEVDAIVNAANSSLAGGGGVDGAIHRRGGPTIMAETDAKYPNGCPTGSAVISTAGNLPAKWVIHAVGPVWSGGHRGEAELLAAAVDRCLELAVAHQCRSIALPALSAGAYRYPIDQAARVALGATIEFLRRHGQPELVRFVLFNAAAYGAFLRRLGRTFPRDCQKAKQQQADRPQGLVGSVFDGVGETTVEHEQAGKAKDGRQQGIERHAERTRQVRPAAPQHGQGQADEEKKYPKYRRGELHHALKTACPLAKTQNQRQRHRRLDRQ